MKIEVAETLEGDAQYCWGCHKDFQGTMVKIQNPFSLTGFHYCAECSERFAAQFTEAARQAETRAVTKRWEVA